MTKPRLLVFASGGAEGGGSGFLHLILNVMSGILKAEIVGVVSNHENGGVREIADKYDVPFFYFAKPYTAERYQAFAKETGAQWFILSGWLKFARGLPVERTINIHPGCSDKFGGPGMYGHHVHEAVIQAYKEERIKNSFITMHFVDEVGYDNGQVFFKMPIAIEPDDTPETLAARINRYEHGWQGFITNLVVNGQIRLEGGRVVAPEWYKKMVFCPAMGLTILTLVE